MSAAVRVKVDDKLIIIKRCNTSLGWLNVGTDCVLVCYLIGIELLNFDLSERRI